MAERRLKRGWWLVGAAVGTVALWLAVPLGLRQLDFFRVRRIELVGLRYLPAEVILAAFGAPDSANLFDGWADNRDRVQAVAGIRTVEVDRRLPGTLLLVVAETTPVALSPESNRMVLVAGDGGVLPFDPSRSAPDLPILVTVDSATARLLARVRTVAPRLYARISTARPIEGDVLLTLDRARLWFRPDASPKVIRSVLAVERDLVRRGQSFAELDGRFADQVVVRRRPA